MPVCKGFIFTLVSIFYFPEAAAPFWSSWPSDRSRAARSRLWTPTRHKHNWGRVLFKHQYCIQVFFSGLKMRYWSKFNSNPRFRDVRNVQTGPLKLIYVYNGIREKWSRIKWYTRSICTLLYINFDGLYIIMNSP